MDPSFMSSGLMGEKCDFDLMFAKLVIPPFQTNRNLWNLRWELTEIPSANSDL